MRISFEREHDQDREEQRYEREWADMRNEVCPVPFPALKANEKEPRDESGEERNAQVQTDTLGDLGNANLDDASFRAILYNESTR